jgi:hypothetical protein
MTPQEIIALTNALKNAGLSPDQIAQIVGDAVKAASPAQPVKPEPAKPEPAKPEPVKPKLMLSELQIGFIMYLTDALGVCEAIRAVSCGRAYTFRELEGHSELRRWMMVFLDDLRQDMGKNNLRFDGVKGDIYIEAFNTCIRVSVTGELFDMAPHTASFIKKYHDNTFYRLRSIFRKFFTYPRTKDPKDEAFLLEDAIGNYLNSRGLEVWTCDRFTYEEYIWKSQGITLIPEDLKEWLNRRLE